MKLSEAAAATISLKRAILSLLKAPHLRPAKRQMQAGMAGIRRVTLHQIVRNA